MSVRDLLLYAVFPYAALTLVVAVPPLRWLASPARRAALPQAWQACRRLYHGERLLLWTLGLVLLGHVLIFALPGPAAAWSDRPADLMVVEGAGFLLGLAALAGLVRLMAERCRTRVARTVGLTLLGSAADCLLLMLATFALGSGLAMAAVHRWGLSWYGVLLHPYLLSLVHCRPEVGLVAAAPPLVRFHLLASFAMAAVLPCTHLGAALVWPLARLVRRRGAADSRRERREQEALG